MFDALLSPRRGRGHNPASFPQLARQHRCSSGYTQWPQGVPLAPGAGRTARAPVLPLPPVEGVAGDSGVLLALLHHLGAQRMPLPTHTVAAALLGGHWTYMHVARVLDHLEERGLILRRRPEADRFGAQRAIDLVLRGTTLRTQAAIDAGFE